MMMLPRHARPEDCERVLAVIDEWWGGPTTSSYLPHVFFSHLASTSFVLEAHDGVLVGFLLGFLSQVRPDAACVHTIGVHPAFRRLGFGRRLYERFFVTAQMSGRRFVRVVSPPSDQSIAFHRAMGFVALGRAGAAGDSPPRQDPGGTGVAPVVFARRIVHDAPTFEPSQAAEAAVTDLDAEVLRDIDAKGLLDRAARVPDHDRAGDRR
jgi:predicted GNAT superfamily acetyltransferase